MKDVFAYLPFEPTANQREALEKMLAFCNAPACDTAPVFMLHGYAGTGKTSIMEALLNYYAQLNDRVGHEDDEYRYFCLMAATGRAARILGGKTGRIASTVHKSIYKLDGRNLDENDEINEIRFVLNLNQGSPRTIVVVDESSMLSDHAVEGLHLQYGTGRLLSDLLLAFNSSRFIFIGDPAQLPPVNTKLSIALDPVAFEQRFGMKAVETELSEVKRFDQNSGIYKGTALLRSYIESENFSMPRVQDNQADIIGYHSFDAMIQTYLQNLRRDLSAGVVTPGSMLVTYTNRMVNYVNTQARGFLYQGSNKINEGENLMVLANNYKFDLMNGDVVKILKASQQTEMRAGIIFRDVTISVGCEPFVQQYNCKMMDELLTLPSGRLEYKREIELFVDFNIRMRKRGILFKNNAKLFMDEYRNDPYMQALRARYGYASTCHKAQGGEWNEVFVVPEKVMFLSDSDRGFSYRWLYTSLTRAAQKIHILQDYGFDLPLQEGEQLNPRKGEFLGFSFTGVLVVNSVHTWRSFKGNDMLTLFSDKQYLLLASRNKVGLPLVFPVQAVFQYGSLVRWIEMNQM